MTIYNLGNVKGDKGDRGECAPGPTGPAGVGIKSIEQINPARFKFCLTDGSEYIMVYGSQPATLSLVSDKNIIETGETANITATVLDENDNPLSGQTVTIEVRKQSDDSLVETLSVTDEDDGTYTASYLGQGTGDIYIKADCMLLTQRYSIEDCYDYQPMTTNADESKWNIPSAVSSSGIFGYSSDGWKFGNASSYSTITYYNTVNRPFSLGCTVTDSNGLQPIIGAMFGSSYIFFTKENNQLIVNVNGSQTRHNVSFQSVYDFKYELTDTTFSVYIDDVLIATGNHSLTGNCTPAFQTSNNRYTVVKDFKLKPL